MSAEKLMQVESQLLHSQSGHESSDASPYPCLASSSSQSPLPSHRSIPDVLPAFQEVRVAPLLSDCEVHTREAWDWEPLLDGG